MRKKIKTNQKSRLQSDRDFFGHLLIYTIYEEKGRNELVLISSFNFIKFLFY